jgi:hypothetical protein
MCVRSELLTELVITSLEHVRIKYTNKCTAWGSLRSWVQSFICIRAYLAAWGPIKKTAQLQRVEKQTKEDKKSQDKAEKEDKGLQLIHLKEKVKSKDRE